MRARSSLAPALLAVALAFSAVAQGVEDEEEGIPDSALAALEEIAAEAVESRDTCFPLSEAYRAAAEKSYPTPPDFKPTSCTTGAGVRVVMRCETIHREPSVAVADQGRAATVEYRCRTARYSQLQRGP